MSDAYEEIIEVEPVDDVEYDEGELDPDDDYVEGVDADGDADTST